MRKTRNHTTVRRFFAWCLAFIMTISLGMPVFVRAETVLSAVSETPSEGCVFIGISGRYITDTKAAIDRINEIRREACEEGVISPSTNQPLTLADYVPIQWSSDMEKIARIRASEAGVAFKHSAIGTGHCRLNDASIWKFDYAKGISVSGEVIAYNTGTDVVSSINQWYGEKGDWVNQTGKTTGHYTQMINPDNTYVGLGTFYSDAVYWRNTTVGWFAKGSGADETQLPAVDSCVQTVDVKTEYISGVSLADSTVKLGGIAQCTLKASIPGMVKDVTVLKDITWTSSKPSVATVDNQGRVKGIGTGEAVITAVSGGLTATCTITVTCDHSNIELRNQKDASLTEAGYTGDSYCADCGSLLAKGTEIPKLIQPEPPTTEEVTTEEGTTAENLPQPEPPADDGKTENEKVVKEKTINKAIYKLDVKKKTAVYSKVKSSAKGTLTIPESVKVDGVTYKVTSIAANAFKNNKKITKVIIGSNVKTIGRDAFYGCKNLKKIVIKTKKLTKGSVGKNAFKGIYRKVKIQVPGSKLKLYKKVLKARGISKKASIKK